MGAPILITSPPVAVSRPEHHSARSTSSPHSPPALLFSSVTLNILDAIWRTGPLKVRHLTAIGLLDPVTITGNRYRGKGKKKKKCVGWELQTCECEIPRGLVLRRGGVVTRAVIVRAQRASSRMQSLACKSCMASSPRPDRASD